MRYRAKKIINIGKTCQIEYSEPNIKRIKRKNDEFLQLDIRSKAHNANIKRLVNKSFCVFGCVFVCVCLGMSVCVHYD